jgi:hypothetical protein
MSKATKWSHCKTPNADVDGFSQNTVNNHVGSSHLNRAVVNRFDPDYSGICGQISDAIATVNRDWRITSCNSIFAKYFGLTQEKVVGRTAFELNPNFDRSIFYPVIQQVFDTKSLSSGLGYSGSVKRWLYMRAYSLDRGCVVFLSDATDLDSSHHQMAAVTRRDPLTGLENRLALEAYLPHTIKAGAPFDLFMIDIARFKQINDSLGYGFGDRALMELGSRFKAVVPAGGSVSGWQEMSSSFFVRNRLKHQKPLSLDFSLPCASRCRSAAAASIWMQPSAGSIFRKMASIWANCCGAPTFHC